MTSLKQINDAQKAKFHDFVTRIQEFNNKSSLTTRQLVQEIYACLGGDAWDNPAEPFFGDSLTKIDEYVNMIFLKYLEDYNSRDSSMSSLSFEEFLNNNLANLPSIKEHLSKVYAKYMARMQKA